MGTIYDYEKRLQSIEGRIKQHEGISEKNKELILNFKNDCFAHNIGYARVVRYMYCLRDLAVWLALEFSEATVNDLKTLVACIEQKEQYSARTKYEYRATLKKFFKWLKNTDVPEEVAWLKLNFKKHNHKLPSDLLTEEEITAMINHTMNPRDRAIIISLFESGCRIGEFIKLKLKDVMFDKYGAFLTVTGKTGGRRIRVVTAAPYLIEWVNKHPYKDTPEAFLWLKHNTSEMLAYPACCKLLRVAARKASIKKKVNPHNFRHARATQLANKLTEQQLKIFFGWTRSSDMASVYVHLSGRDVNDALLNTYGIQTDGDASHETKLMPQACSRCQQHNEATNKYCKTCGFVLDKQESHKLIQQATEQSDLENTLSKLLHDPEVLALIKHKLSQKTSNNT